MLKIKSFFASYFEMLHFVSVRKLRLLFLLRLSYVLSIISGKDIRWGAYVSCSVEGSSACNLSCPECPSGLKSLKRASAHFPFPLYQKILAEKWRDLIYLNFYFQGEPFLNKDLPKMIKAAAEKRIYTSVSTNANLIQSDLAEEIVLSGLHRLIISIDGTTQETYASYRKGGRLDKVLLACRYINEYKKKHNSIYPKLVFQFLVFKHNEHEIKDIKALAKQYKVDKLELKSAQIYDFDKKPEMIPSLAKYARYKQDKDGKWVIKSALKHRCWRMWHSVVVIQDGRLVPCCFDKDGDFQYGNAYKESIGTIEGSKAYKQFRQKISRHRSQIEMCRNCTEGLNL